VRDQAGKSPANAKRFTQRGPSSRTCGIRASDAATKQAELHRGRIGTLRLRSGQAEATEQRNLRGTRRIPGIVVQSPPRHRAHREKQKLLGGCLPAEGEEILRALHGLLDAAEEGLKVLVASDKVDIGSVYDKKIGGGIAEEEVFVGLGDLSHIVRRYLFFGGVSFFGDALAQDFWPGLEIDDQVRARKASGQKLEITVVELQFLVVEIDAGENLVLFEDEIADDRAGLVGNAGVGEAAMALVEEIQLRAKGSAGLFFIEGTEVGIVVGVEDAASLHTAGENPGQSSLPGADGAFYGDKTGALERGSEFAGTGDGGHQRKL